MKQNKSFLPHWFKYIDLENKECVGVTLFENEPFYVYEHETVKEQGLSVAIFLDGVFYPPTTGAAYHFMNLLMAFVESSLNVYLFRCYRGWEDPGIYEKLPFNTVCIDPEVFYDDLESQLDVLRKYSISTLVFDTSEVILLQGTYFKEKLGLKIIHDIQNVDHVLSKLGGLPLNIVEKQKQELIDADAFVDFYWAKTEIDKKHLKNEGIEPKKIKVRFPIIDTNIIKYELREELNNNIKGIYLGNMYYPPNIEGLEVLETTYKDCVKDGIKFEVDVVGDGNLEELTKKYPYFNFRGKVDSLNDLFIGYDLAFACPSYGSGISLKVLDYMAAGLPVIANGIGVRGHPSEVSNHVLINNSSSLFLSIKNLIENPFYYRNLSDSNLKYIDKYFNKKNTIKKYEEDLENLVTSG